MGKDWDRLAPTGGASFTTGGSERFSRASLPSYTGTPNRVCRTCKGTERGNDRQGFHRCRCEMPDFPNIRGQQAKAQQQWHRGWLTEAHRVLVSGGVVKAFGGTRTYHRLAAAMEEAGFQDIRLEAWNYSTGFPKSLNISSAIDKQYGRIGVSIIALKKELRRLFDESGKGRKQIDLECGFRACNYLSYPEPGKQPDPWFAVLPSREKWEVMKHVLGCDTDPDLEDRLDRFFSEAEREVVGQQTKARAVGVRSPLPTMGAEVEYRTWDVTTSTTPEGQAWEGWHTSLKPAWEPVLIGRKVKA